MATVRNEFDDFDDDDGDESKDDIELSSDNKKG